MSFVNWVIDFLSREDVIDLYFNLTNLFEIHQTTAEIVENAELDNLCDETIAKNAGSNFDPFRPDTWPDYSGKDVF